MMSAVWFLIQLSIVIVVVNGCSPFFPPDGTLYVSNFQLLDDPNYLLMTIEAYNDAKVSQYCKMLNVNDGTVSNVVSCTPSNTRTWSTGNIDTSTQIVSAQDNKDGTADITLKRNDANVGITGIPYSGSGGTNFYYDQFTLSSTYTTFVLLAPSQSNMEIVQITFSSQSDNSSPKVKNFGIAAYEWQNWEVGSPINMIPVYEDANAIQLPLICCLCASNFIARYYFSYDAMSGDISGIEIDTTVWGGRVDDVAQKAFSHDPSYPTSITVYDLKNIGGSSSVYALDLTYTTDSPSKSPTNQPSISPTEQTLSPSNNPTQLPSTGPTKSPSNPPTVSSTKGASSGVDTGTTLSLSSVSNGGGEGGNDQTNGDETAEGFIVNISKNSPWVIIMVGVLLLCAAGLICFYCIHNRKLKNRLETLENQTKNGEFAKVDEKSPIPTDTDTNDLNPLNHQNFAFANVNLRSNIIPNTGSDNDTNPVFLNPGDGVPNVNGNDNKYNNTNNNNEHDGMYEMGEGGLPLPPEQNENVMMYNTPNGVGDDIASNFSSSDDIMADNHGVTRNDQHYIVNVNKDDVDNDDNVHDDMYNDENKTVVSIQEAKKLNVSDKEAYLSDDDFKKIFGITKDEFYKMKLWKQKNLKQTHGFF